MRLFNPPRKFLNLNDRWRRSHLDYGYYPEGWMVKYKGNWYTHDQFEFRFRKELEDKWRPRLKDNFKSGG